MFKRTSLTWYITLPVILLAMIVVLLVLWIIGQASDQHWALLTVGAIFFGLILIGVVVYFIWTFREYRLNRRQANFIDSVTHELKSPIASLKLVLQTLEMRLVSPEQQHEFHKFMMEDIQRLDSLVDHLLAAAQLDHAERDEKLEDVPLAGLLKNCADEVRRRYELNPDQIRLEIEPCMVRGRPRDLEMVIVNLMDNAAKYGAAEGASARANGNAEGQSRCDQNLGQWKGRQFRLAEEDFPAVLSRWFGARADDERDGAGFVHRQIARQQDEGQDPRPRERAAPRGHF